MYVLTALAGIQLHLSLIPTVLQSPWVLNSPRLTKPKFCLKTFASALPALSHSYLAPALPPSGLCSDVNPAWHLHRCLFFFLLNYFSSLPSYRQCKRCKKHEFNLWVRKIPWRRKWQPTPVFLPGKSHGQRSLVGYSPWGDKESDMAEHTAHIPPHQHRTHCKDYISIFHVYLLTLDYRCHEDKDLFTMICPACSTE